MARKQWIRDRFPILLQQGYYGYCQRCEMPKKKHEAKFCSVECYNKTIRALSPEANRICKKCQKEFRINPAYLKRRKNAGLFCSRNCYYLYQRSQPIKDKYGRSRRIEDREWQKIIREKYNYTCQRCGKYNKYIHTHHVKTRSQFPELKYDTENGICLCNSCHTWVHDHPRESAWQGWMYSRKYISYQGDPMNKKPTNKKADWGQTHICINCKRRTSLYLCHFCGKVSIKVK